MARPKRKTDPIDTGTPERGGHDIVALEQFDPLKLGVKKGTGAVRARVVSYLETLERRRTIDRYQLDAANLFYEHFNRAQLNGYSSIDMFKIGNKQRGPSTIADTILESRARVRSMLLCVPGFHQRSIIWDVCGLGLTVAEWRTNRRNLGFNIGRDAAVGYLVATLETLSHHRETR